MLLAFALGPHKYTTGVTERETNAHKGTEMHAEVDSDVEHRSDAEVSTPNPHGSAEQEAALKNGRQMHCLQNSPATFSLNVLFRYR